LLYTGIFPGHLKFAVIKALSKEGDTTSMTLVRNDVDCTANLTHQIGS